MSTKHRDELAQQVLRLTEDGAVDGRLAGESLRHLRVYAELADLEAAADLPGSPTVAPAQTPPGREVVLSS